MTANDKSTATLRGSEVFYVLLKLYKSCCSLSGWRESSQLNIANTKVTLGKMNPNCVEARQKFEEVILGKLC